MQTVSIIAAVAANRVIGIDNRLPWSLPDDWKHFREVTAGKAFLMGRKSYQAEDSLTSDYQNYILSSRSSLDLCERCTLVNSFEAFLKATENEAEVFVLGGDSVFEQALRQDIVDKMYLTHVHANPKGDAFFPEVNWENWEEVSSKFHPKDAENEYPFHINTYIRKKRSRL